MALHSAGERTSFRIEREGTMGCWCLVMFGGVGERGTAPSLLRWRTAGWRLGGFR